METNVELLDRLKGLERSSRFTLPFIAVGLIAVISSLVYASIQLNLVQSEVREAEKKRLESAAAIRGAEERLATLQNLIKQLNADVRVAASGSVSSTEQAAFLVNAAAAGETLARQSEAATAALTKLSTCNKVVSIRELGWRSGHKTNFCKAHGYAGVHNPFGDYSLGGYCYSGDLDTCMAEVQSGSQ
jgi:hypothetical protein